MFFKKTCGPTCKFGKKVSDRQYQRVGLKPTKTVVPFPVAQSNNLKSTS